MGVLLIPARIGQQQPALVIPAAVPPLPVGFQDLALRQGAAGTGIILLVVSGFGMRLASGVTPAAMGTQASFLALHGQGADLVLWSPLLVALWLAATGRRLPGGAGWMAVAGAVIWLCGAVGYLPWSDHGGWSFYTPYSTSRGWFDDVQRQLIWRATAHAGLGVAAVAVVLSLTACLDDLRLTVHSLEISPIPAQPGDAVVASFGLVLVPVQD